MTLREADDNGLSQPAKLAIMSLEEHPHLNTPEAIASSPMSIQQVEAHEIEDGLRELEVAGRAVQTFTGWQLVEQAA